MDHVEFRLVGGGRELELQLGIFYIHLYEPFLLRLQKFTNLCFLHQFWKRCITNKIYELYISILFFSFIALIVMYRPLRNPVELTQYCYIFFIYNDIQINTTHIIVWSKGMGSLSSCHNNIQRFNTWQYLNFHRYLELVETTKERWADTYVRFHGLFWF